jgi:hypothetical protein
MDKEKEDAPQGNDDQPTQKLEVDELGQYSNLLKRKQEDLQIMESIMEKRRRTIEMITESARQGSPNRQEYTYRISKLSNSINFDTSGTIDFKDSNDEP